MVFVSYARVDARWRDIVREGLADVEAVPGVDIEVFADEDILHGADWYELLFERMRRAKVAVLLVSKTFLRSDFCRFEEVPYLLQRARTEGLAVLPLVVEPCLWKRYPWLKRLNVRPVDGRTLAAMNEVERLEELTRLGETILDIVEGTWQEPSRVDPGGPKPLAVDIDRLPGASEVLFGRRKEWNALDGMLDGGRTRIVVYEAAGGVGKTSLVRWWVDALKAEGWRGLRRVFAWSFYSQGTGQKVTSAASSTTPASWSPSPPPPPSPRPAPTSPMPRTWSPAAGWPSTPPTWPASGPRWPPPRSPKASRGWRIQRMSGWSRGRDHTWCSDHHGSTVLPGGPRDDRPR